MGGKAPTHKRNKNQTIKLKLLINLLFLRTIDNAFCILQI